MDSFSVSLSVTHLQEQFGKSTRDTTTSIPLTLVFRSVLFGILSASVRFGRKWPLVWNLFSSPPLSSVLVLCRHSANSLPCTSSLVLGWVESGLSQPLVLLLRTFLLKRGVLLAGCFNRNTPSVT
ncbi:hypothetical protein BDZ97DRAFT_1874819 [Flammula alnicola]|nr:hypothetical protein BDZ97DRAFT_1874819 [Flammula alnicola]